MLHGISHLLRTSSNAELLQVVDELLQFTGSEGNELYKLPAWHYADVARPAGSQISLREDANALL